ncbi:MAG TPA: tail tape measure protein, partial [Chromatiales bacterium]|nr:tail tape measure protein [Chromatiales bacterium]
MSNLRASIIIDMAGNLVGRAQRYGQALGRFSQRGQRDLGRLSRASAALGRGLDRIGNRYTALLTGAGAAGTAKMLVDLELRFTRLGIQANQSAESMNALKQEIYDAASAPDVRVDPGEITSAIEAIVEKTGDLDFARENIRNIGIAIQATGAQGGAIGELMAELQKMGDFKGPEDVLAALDTLTVQGKEGAFTLQNLAALGPRVITAYSGAVKGSRDGATVLKEMGAALQVIRMGTGSSEQAATAFERLLAELQNVDKLKLLQQGGIQVFDPEQPGAEVMRPINELLLEIMEKTQGRRTLLGKIFGDESVRAFNALSPERIERFMAAQGDGSTTMNDSARAAATASAALTNLFSAWKQFADSNLTAPIQALADALNSLDKEQMDTIMEALKWGGIALGGAILTRKVGGAIGGFRRGGAKGALGEAAGIPGMAGITPVYVVNLPPGMGGKGGLPGRGGKGGLGGGSGHINRGGRNPI